MKYRRVVAIVALLFYATFSLAAQRQICTLEGDCVEPGTPSVAYGLPPGQILGYSEPGFETLPVDSSLLYDRRYMQVAGLLNIYDAPNGNIVRTLDAGFNYVTILDQQGNWTQINPGEWVQSTYLTDVNSNISWFTGVFLPDQLPEYPIAWTLVNVYPSKEPGGQPWEGNGLMYRYTRVNIFDVVEVDGWEWYQVGVGKWLIQTHVAKVRPVERPEEVDTERWISIDLYEQVLVVYDDDRPIFATLISTGLPRWPTYEGVFHIHYRVPRRDMSWGTPGDDFYYLEEVPWTLFFDEGRAIHGTYWHDGLGYRRSHGCINLSITDAYWLYHWVAEEFETLRSPDIENGPAVYVYSSGIYR